MELSKGEIRPGKVLSVEDNFGTIKASVVGLFSEEDDVSLIPPIYPFLKTSTTSFSKPKVGDKIWVLFFRDNNQELFYFFQGDVNATASGNVSVKHNPVGSEGVYDGDVEVLLDRNTEGDGTERVTIAYNDETGVQINNKNSCINVDNNSNITISNGKSVIKIKDNGNIEICAADEDTTLENTINIQGKKVVVHGEEIDLNGSVRSVATAEGVAMEIDRLKSVLGTLFNQMLCVGVAGTIQGPMLAAQINGFSANTDLIASKTVKCK